jgi:hypothetical protein
MNSETVAALVKAGSTVFVGIYFTLVGHRLVGHKRGANLKVDAWHDQYGGFFRVVGPLVAIGGLVFLAIKLAS